MTPVEKHIMALFDIDPHEIHGLTLTLEVGEIPQLELRRHVWRDDLDPPEIESVAQTFELTPLPTTEDQA